MRIKEWTWKNYKSYGSVPQTIRFEDDKGELILLIGENGAGKCVDKSTEIDIEINDLVITPILIHHLERTESGRMIFQYIRENNTLLYEKIRDFRENS